MSKYSGRTEKEENMQNPRINVTPLIDVLLVLLIIFMVISPMKPSSFKAKVPSEPDNNPIVHPNPETLVVTVDRTSVLGINHETGLGSVDEPQKMVDRLKDVFAERKIAYSGSADGSRETHTAVFIKAPRGIDYGSVAKVLDAVKSSGADPIALQVDDLN